MTTIRHKPPRIGLTPDLDDRDAPETGYTLRRNYADAVTAAGGVPLVLTYAGGASDYLDIIDGLVVTGGMFDIDPELYGATARGAIRTKAVRTAFEWALIEGALARDMPVLGICNGMQLLAVILGGRLVQHIPSEVEGALAHMAEDSAWRPQHEIDLVPGSLLARLVPDLRQAVNSVHHQSVLPSPRYAAAALATDGVVEAIEVPGRPFCIGLQWHPEYHASATDTPIWEAFVAASGTYAKTVRPA